MRHAVVLDAQLSVLLAVGATGRHLIRSHKRLSAYDERDFDILVEVMNLQETIVWCPNVLSETSNLTRQINEPARSAIANTLMKLVSTAAESYVPSVEAVARPEYQRLGLTDAALLTLAAGDAVLLTADLDLHVAAETAGMMSVNFNTLRDRRPDFR